jgi:hypothetical protein
MSRMEIGLPDSTDLPLLTSDSDLLTEVCQPKKRTDWSEYLDPIEETKDDKDKENGLCFLYILIYLLLI